MEPRSGRPKSVQVRFSQAGHDGWTTAVTSSLSQLALDSDRVAPRSRAGDSRRSSFYNNEAACRGSTRVGSIRERTDLGRTDTDHSHYQVGQLVRVLHTEPSVNPKACAEDDAISVSRIGGPICQKLRPCIVIAVYYSHIKVIPIYTSGGQGMTKKPAAVREFRMYVTNEERYDNGTWACKDTDMTRPVLKMATGSPFEISDGAHIDLTDDFIVRYHCPIRNVADSHYRTMLTAESITLLKNAWMASNKAGVDVVVKILAGAEAKKAGDRPRSVCQSAQSSRRPSVAFNHKRNSRVF